MPAERWPLRLRPRTGLASDAQLELASRCWCDVDANVSAAPAARPRTRRRPDRATGPWTGSPALALLLLLLAASSPGPSQAADSLAFVKDPTVSNAADGPSARETQGWGIRIGGIDSLVALGGLCGSGTVLPACTLTYYRLRLGPSGGGGTPTWQNMTFARNIEIAAMARSGIASDGANAVYTFGGWQPGAGGLLAFGGTGVPYGGTVIKFDFTNLEAGSPTATVIGPYDAGVRRFAHCMVYYNNALYATGGAGVNITNNLLKFDLTGSSWAELQATSSTRDPKPRYGNVCAMFGSRMYSVLGGISGGGGTTDPTGTAFGYVDLAASPPAWTFLGSGIPACSLPKARLNPCVCSSPN